MSASARTTAVSASMLVASRLRDARASQPASAPARCPSDSGPSGLRPSERRARHLLPNSRAVPLLPNSRLVSWGPRSSSRSRETAASPCRPVSARPRERRWRHCGSRAQRPSEASRLEDRSRCCRGPPGPRPSARHRAASAVRDVPHKESDVSAGAGLFLRPSSSWRSPASPTTLGRPAGASVTAARRPAGCAQDASALPSSSTSRALPEASSRASSPVASGCRPQLARLSLRRCGSAASNLRRCGPAPSPSTLLLRSNRVYSRPCSWVARADTASAPRRRPRRASRSSCAPRFCARTASKNSRARSGACWAPGLEQAS
mmetsp:Transcript_83837/g.234171  ORF Transcript_83837/g.234171 Transcript_83837/m.234171 type:complete len:319 (+) Transcript_83837:935-1891(+)